MPDASNTVPIGQSLDHAIRVLHVDDEVDQRSFTKMILESLDKSMEVESVSNPEEVIERLQNGRFDCVVSDYQMPGLSGIELARRIKETMDIPVIIYTGRGSDEIAREAFEAKADDYVQKEMEPAHYLLLDRRIRVAVESRRMRELYGTVVNGNRDAVVIVEDSKIMYANQAMAALVLIDDPLMLRGSNWLKWFEAVDRSDIQKAIKEKEGTGENLHKFTLVDNSGRRRQVDMKCNSIIYNGSAANLCFIRQLPTTARAH